MSKKWWTVEMRGECRELYAVEAETPEEARERWMDGRLTLSEASSMDVYAVREDDQ